MSKKTKIKIGLAENGHIFVLGLIVLLFISIAYANNLAYGYTFFLVAICLISLQKAYDQLNKIEFLSMRTESGFVNRMISSEIILQNKSEEDLYSLEMRLNSGEKYQLQQIAAGAQKKSILSIKSPKRGQFHIDEFTLSTTFPFGILKLSRKIEVSSSYYVYPSPKGTQALPAQDTLFEGNFYEQKSGDDFAEHRFFQAGESHRHIDWKLRARGGPLMVKVFDEGGAHTYCFNIDKVESKDLETQLSQLSAWICRAESENSSYQLIMPGFKSEILLGHEHYQHCLRKLACVESERSHD